MSGLLVLAGVGPVRASRLERLGVQTPRDLLLLQPRRLAVRGPRVSVREARAREGSEVSAVGALGAVRFHRSGRGRSLVRVRLEQDGAGIDLLFFNQPWQRERLRALAAAGQPVEALGRVVATASGPALAAPRLGTPESPLPAPGALCPVYALVDGLTQGFVRATVQAAVEAFGAELDEPLPAAALARLGLPPLRDAVRALHAPDDLAGFLAARRRVALEPMLALFARIAARRAAAPAGARALATPREDVDRAFEPFGVAPTAAQRRALEECLADLARPTPMRRLLQGDVGTGKTLVAAALMLAACRAGGQAALCAPTELLAEQHHAALAPALARAGVRAVLCTGSLPRAERRAAEKALESGAAGVAIGTHALLSRAVRFRRLDLAVIDEEQRFGVSQRRALIEKGDDVHALSMTATPIPRTLARAAYGDLEQSVLDESPPGRGPVETVVLDPSQKERVVRRLGERLAAGERAYWVAPRIDADDDAEREAGAVTAAEKAHRELSAALGPHGVELVHGRLAREERAARLERFRRGASRLCVGTTVIEVGVDVPEATILVVDGAEHFGLAQLHQLRGRIGRGARASTCVLLARGEGAERARVLARTRDGFEIAEEDLRRRGMGDLGGLRQSGDPGLGPGLGDPEADLELLALARELAADPDVAARYAAPDQSIGTIA